MGIALWRPAFLQINVSFCGFQRMLLKITKQKTNGFDLMHNPQGYS